MRFVSSYLQGDFLTPTSSTSYVGIFYPADKPLEPSPFDAWDVPLLSQPCRLEAFSPEKCAVYGGGDNRSELRVAPSPVQSQSRRSTKASNQKRLPQMTPSNRCSIQDDLVSELAALSTKLNTLSPNWVRSEQAREEIQQRREALQIELKRHRAKGHDGQRCPGFNPRPYSFSAAR